MDASLTSKLRGILGEEGFLTAPEDLRCYSFDLFSRGLPEAVALPTSTEQVALVLKVAHDAGVAVTPRGAASSLAGGPVPRRGGIALCLARMNRILEISPADRLARAEAGVLTGDFQRAVLKQNLFYPPNPTSSPFCTLGGNIATNAGGASGVKYGVTRDYLLGLTAVLADGTVIRTGGRCLKNVAGYDLSHILCGSEGRLAVITEATFRLLPPPEAVRTILAYLPSVEESAALVFRIIGAGIVPSTLELMDDGFLKTVSEVYGLDFPEKARAALLIEVDGPAGEVEKQAARIEDMASGGAYVEVRRARDEKERALLWQARAGGTAALVRQARFMLTLDFAVPVSAIPEATHRVQEIAARHALKMVLIAHAGDGNLHPMFIYDPDDPAENAAYLRAEEELTAAMLELGGTLSGEHGIGEEKAGYLARQLGEAEAALNLRLKRAFDPAGILNPGKCEEVPQR